MNAQALDIQHTVDIQPAPPRNVVTATDMLSQALASGAGVEVIEKLMALRDRQEATMARRAFDEALAAAKAEIPVTARLTSRRRRGALTTPTKTLEKLPEQLIRSLANTACRIASA